ncbi:3459_t:CDS:2 [Acaulospora morrowiae]|uniref:3459_t:CDS:1 n=1 Tax=Acaulospora morrowiae TaxID=94023 RepID=A0A9N9BED3_9GLOM|nr:3459_t:CDS:2 [Acaulospora morrowiae]
MKSRIEIFGFLLFFSLLLLSIIQCFWEGSGGNDPSFLSSKAKRGLISDVTTTLNSTLDTVGHNTSSSSVTDACAKIHQNYLKNKSSYQPSYLDVRACFGSFQYDKTRAGEIIGNIKNILENFYPFLDQAKEQPQPGFTFPSTDIIHDLDALLLNPYTTDFQFMSDLQSKLFQLKDAHLLFFSNCYNQIFTFDQQLTLYSMVKSDGSQVIKILSDTNDSSLTDCEVTSIDGLPSMAVLTDFANTQTFTSKDLGVRFNSVLGSIGLESGSFRISEFTQQFTKRRRLPSEPSHTYTLSCNGAIKTINRSWKISSSYYDGFTNSSSYWNNFCAASKFTVPSVFNDFNPGQTFDNSLSKGQLVYSGTFSRFYLIDQIGVAVISTIVADDDPTSAMQDLANGFNTLSSKGAKKLVLDLSNNSGGSILVSEFICALLFRDTDPAFPRDMRVTDFSKLAIDTATTKNVSDSIFYAPQYNSFATKQAFSSSSDFIGKNVYTRGGSQVSYTNQFSYTVNSNYSQQVLSNQSVLPWASQDMIILSNGICGSSCATISQHLAELNNVKTVAVGGFANKPLSFASFPGGQVYNHYELLYTLQEIGLISNENSPQPFSINALFSFPIFEAYSTKNSGQVLEFSYRKAGNRLYYNEKSIRDPSLLWVQAAALI